MKRKPLPPFGKEFLASDRRYGPFVFMGPHAWNLARRRAHSGPCMVLPEGADPLNYFWPVAGVSVILIESGTFDTPRLERTALALMRDGAPVVTPIRNALLAKHPPQMWTYYVKDKNYVRRNA